MTIEFFPAGYRYTSVIIAYAKRVLTMPEARFTPNEQLGALQSIGKPPLRTALRFCALL